MERSPDAWTVAVGVTSSTRLNDLENEAREAADKESTGERMDNRFVSATHPPGWLEGNELGARMIKC